VTVARLKPGEHTIRATYSGGGMYNQHSSSSPNLSYTAATWQQRLTGTRTRNRWARPLQTQTEVLRLLLKG